MIIRHNNIDAGDFSKDNALSVENNNDLYKNALFLDLEHYIYRKPICIGVFGCSYYDEEQNLIKVTQYMIENKNDSYKILGMSRDYFKNMNKNYNKNNIITFSGNNDFTVINHLFKKNNIRYNIDNNYNKVDLQKEYEKNREVGIGLKDLEKTFGIKRDSDLISGSNLAKTFKKIMKDDKYCDRMPEDKKDKILLYNEQDVTSLFFMCVNWNNVLN